MNNQLILRPSSSARRIACPGSFKLEAKYPQIEESEHAIEGTLAHEFAHNFMSKIFSGANDALAFMSDTSEKYTEEMKENAKLYYCLVFDLSDKGRYFIQLEKEIPISNIHPWCKGTPDSWIVVNNKLYVIDYKFGHKPVDAYENSQLLEYAAGAILYWEKYLLHPRLENIELIIVQPRDFKSDESIKRWSLTREEAEGYFAQLVIAEALATQDDAPLRVNALCGTCSARHACPALQASALDKADHTMINATRELNAEETANELRYLMHAAKVLDARITGLSEVALSYLKKGTRLPHFILESAESRENWTISIDKIMELGTLYNADLSKLNVITPRQAIQKGVPENIVKSISERKLGRPRLTIDDGKKSKRAFNK